MRPRAALSLAFLTTLLLAGCATATTSPGAVPVASPPASTSTPTPSPSAEVVLTPTVPFGGDCERVLTAADLDGFFGEQWATEETKTEEWGIGEYLDVAPIETVGGLQCRWFVDDAAGDSVTGVSVTIAPEESLPIAYTGEFREAECGAESDAKLCRMARIEGDLWVLAQVSDLMTQPAPDLLPDLLDAVSAHLPTPAQSVSDAGWWSLPSCEDFGAAMALQELIGEGYNTGLWEGEESFQMAALREAGVSVLCEWSTGDGRLAPDGGYHVPSITIVNGGHWRWQEFADFDGAESVTVEGADDALVVPGNDGATVGQVLVTDGVNVVEVSGGDREFLLDLAGRAIGALGTA